MTRAFHSRKSLWQTLALGLAAAATTLAGAAPAGGVQRGSEVFAARCAVCHGVHADGDSPLAKVSQVAPPSLRASALSANERRAIVTGGGSSVGRTPNMPAWGEELSAEDLSAVLAYLASIAPGSRHAAAR